MKKEDLQKSKQWLPRGYGRRIYNETGITFTTIYATMNGKTHNQRVIDTAIAIAKEEKEKNEKAKNEIAAL